MINREPFFAEVRTRFGPLTENQVDGFGIRKLEFVSGGCVD